MKNSLRNLQLFAVAIFTILSASSCSSAASVYRAGYSIGLDAIMGPNDKLRENGKMVVEKYGGGITVYSNDYFRAVWKVLPDGFNLSIYNKTDNTIKIDWDNAGYVSWDNKASGLTRSGISLAGLDSPGSQKPTVIPAKERVDDVAIPISNIKFLHGNWTIQTLIPSYYANQEDLDRSAKIYVGNQLTIMLPIIIEGVSYDYSFVFKVNEWLPDATTRVRVPGSIFNNL